MLGLANVKYVRAHCVWNRAMCVVRRIDAIFCRLWQIFYVGIATGDTVCMIRRCFISQKKRILSILIRHSFVYSPVDSRWVCTFLHMIFQLAAYIGTRNNAHQLDTFLWNSTYSQATLLEDWDVFQQQLVNRSICFLEWCGKWFINIFNQLDWRNVERKKWWSLH